MCAFIEMFIKTVRNTAPKKISILMARKNIKICILFWYWLGRYGYHNGPDDRRKMLRYGGHAILISAPSSSSSLQIRKDINDISMPGINKQGEDKCFCK